MATDKKSSGGTSSSGGSGSGSTDKPDGSSASSSQGSSRRPVTIDLQAKKVDAKPGDAPSASSSGPGVSKSGSTGSADPKSSGARPGTTTTSSSVSGSTAQRSGAAAASPSSAASATGQTASTPKQAFKPTASSAASSTGKSASPDSKTAASDNKAGSSPSASGSRPGGSSGFSNPPTVEDRGGVGAFGVLIAAVIGGILVLGGGFGLYQTGIIKLSPEPNQQLASALNSAERKITELERKIEDVASSAAASRNTGNGLTALEAKVTGLESRIEEAVSSQTANAAPDIDALKQDLESLRDEVAGGPASGSGGSGVDLKPLENRVETLEATAANQAQTDQLSASVTGMETQLGDLKTTLAEVQNRLQNTEATAKAAQTAVSTSDVSLKTLADSQARATDTLTSLSADIKSVGDSNSAALKDVDSQLAVLSDRLSQVESTMGDATARETAARALSVSALKSAVDSGRPYETELAAVKAGLPADIDLKALEANAKAGVEPVSVLIAQFPVVARKMFQSFSEPDGSGDVLDSLLASARSIVSVRGPGDADGTGPQAALRQMENAVSNGNLKAALESYRNLPEAAQASGAEWAARAQARVEVDALTDKASQEVLNALAAKDS